MDPGFHAYLLGVGLTTAQIQEMTPELLIHARIRYLQFMLGHNSGNYFHVNFVCVCVS